MPHDHLAAISQALNDPNVDARDIPQHFKDYVQTGVSINYLADLIGMNRTSLLRMLSDGRDIKLSSFLSLIRALKLAIDVSGSPSTKHLKIQHRVSSTLYRYLSLGEFERISKSGRLEWDARQRQYVTDGLRREFNMYINPMVASEWKTVNDIIDSLGKLHE